MSEFLLNTLNTISPQVASIMAIALTTKHIVPKTVDYLDEKTKEWLHSLFKEGKANPQTVIPILEVLPLVNDPILRTMFLNLLETSVDEQKQNLAHPSFPFILKQLCHDEAIMFIERYKEHGDKPYNCLLSMREYIYYGDNLTIPSNYKFYLTHLKDLGIVNNGSYRCALDSKCPNDYFEAFLIGDFGIKFAQACMLSTIDISKIPKLE